MIFQNVSLLLDTPIAKRREASEATESRKRFSLYLSVAPVSRRIGRCLPHCIDGKDALVGNELQFSGGPTIFKPLRIASALRLRTKGLLAADGGDGRSNCNSFPFLRPNRRYSDGQPSMPGNASSEIFAVGSGGPSQNSGLPLINTAINSICQPFEINLLMFSEDVVRKLALICW